LTWFLSVDAAFVTIPFVCCVAYPPLHGTVQNRNAPIEGLGRCAIAGSWNFCGTKVQNLHLKCETCRGMTGDARRPSQLEANVLRLTADGSHTVGAGAVLLGPVA